MKKKPFYILFACSIFLISFGQYLRTLNPVFAADDSPETTTACVTLGIQHPPGYPLHTLLGRLFGLLPLGNFGFRLNLMSAFLGSLALVLLFLNTRLLLKRYLQAAEEQGRALAFLPSGLAFVFSLALGFSPSFWSQCLSAKGGIYTLQALLILLALLSLQGAYQEAERRLSQPQSSRLRIFHSPQFMFLGLCFGLGLANHWETEILFIPALLYLAWLLLRQVKLDPKLPSSSKVFSNFAWAAIFTLLGLSIYFYLPLRSSQHPVMDWGHPATWDQFKWVVLRQEYTDMEAGFAKSVLSAMAGKSTWAEVSANFATVMAQIKRVAWHLSRELGWLGALLSLLGLTLLKQKNQRRYLAFLAAVLVLFFLVIAFYFHLKPEMIWILDVFMIPVYLVQSMFAALGAAWLCQQASQRWSIKPHLLLVSLPLLGLLLFLSQPSQSRASNHQAQNYYAYDYGRNFMQSLKRNSLALAEGDFNVMPISYLQILEGRRPDLHHVTAIFLALPWGVRQMQARYPDLNLDIDPLSVPPSGPLFSASVEKLVQNNKGHRAIQTSLFHEILSQFYTPGQSISTPRGLSYEYFAPASEENQRQALFSSFINRYWQADLETLNDSTQFMLSNYATGYLEQANHLRALGKAAWPQAKHFYLRAIDLAPHQNKAEVWTHYGIALANLPDWSGAEQALLQAVKIKPLFEAYANLAGIYNNQKRYQDGQVMAQKALELNPQSVEAMNNLGISYFYSGHKVEAIAVLQKAASLAPNNPSVAANLRAIHNAH